MVVEETPGIAREETSRKSDSPDARANIRRKAGEAAGVAKTTKKWKGSCRRPPATSASPRKLSSSSSELKSYSESDAVEVQHASVGKKTPGTAGGLRFTRNKPAMPAYTVTGECKLLIRT